MLTLSPSNLNRIMFVGNPVGERSFRLIGSVVIALTFAAIFTCGLVPAQQGRTGGPTPSPQGAGVYFVGLNDGASLPTKMTIRFGLHDMGVAPAGSDRANSGHHHLLITQSFRHSISPFPTISTICTSVPDRPKRKLPSSQERTLFSFCLGQRSHSAQSATYVAPHSSHCGGVRRSDNNRATSAQKSLEKKVSLARSPLRASDPPGAALRSASSA
jgi:hypothetical protein